MRGLFVLVVGPSGAGKDTLLDHARTALGGDPFYVFARRCITRPAGAGSENHEAVTAEEFDARRAAGGFSLWWEAHGLRYGLSSILEHHLAQGRCVIANVSRAVIEEARSRLGPVLVVSITASPEILAARLAARGREVAADRAARLARADAFEIAGPDVVAVTNDGAVEDAVTRFLAVLRSARQAAFV